MAARLRKNGSDAGTAIGISLRIRGLAVQFWPIEKLIPYVKNARTHSEEQVAQVAASIVEFGWTNPILVGADHRRPCPPGRGPETRDRGSAGHRAGPSDGDAAARAGPRRQPPGDERRVGWRCCGWNWRPSRRASSTSIWWASPKRSWRAISEESGGDDCRPNR